MEDVTSHSDPSSLQELDIPQFMHFPNYVPTLIPVLSHRSAPPNAILLQGLVREAGPEFLCKQTPCVLLSKGNKFLSLPWIRTSVVFLEPSRVRSGLDPSDFTGYAYRPTI